MLDHCISMHVPFGLYSVGTHPNHRPFPNIRSEPGPASNGKDAHVPTPTTTAKARRKWRTQSDIVVTDFGADPTPKAPGNLPNGERMGTVENYMNVRGDGSMLSGPADARNVGHSQRNTKDTAVVHGQDKQSALFVESHEKFRSPSRTSPQANGTETTTTRDRSNNELNDIAATSSTAVERRPSGAYGFAPEHRPHSYAGHSSSIRVRGARRQASRVDSEDVRDPVLLPMLCSAMLLVMSTQCSVYMWRWWRV